MIADLAGAAPGHPDRAAALRAQGQFRQVVLAATVYHLGPAGAPPIVHANVTGIVENVSRGTLALVSPQGVDAHAIKAHVRS